MAERDGGWRQADGDWAAHWGQESDGPARVGPAEAWALCSALLRRLLPRALITAVCQLSHPSSPFPPHPSAGQPVLRAAAAAPALRSAARTARDRRETSITRFSASSAVSSTYDTNPPLCRYSLFEAQRVLCVLVSRSLISSCCSTSPGLRGMVGIARNALPLCPDDVTYASVLIHLSVY